MIDLLERLKARYGLPFIAWGHAGDGNLHVCPLQGTITGEHGVGWVQKRPMAANVDPVAVELMKAIKRVLDPRGILNPGKIFLD